MAELAFGCTEARSARYAATPTLSFTLHITESTGVRVHAIALRCQIRIEPHRRRYSADEARRLNDLFGDTSRWAETVKPIQLATVSAMVPGFTSLTEIELPVPCTYDLEVASARYLQGARRRHHPAAAAVQRHGVHRQRGLVQRRADPVELRGFLPDAGGRLAGRRERALPWQRLAAVRPGDAGRAVGVQGRPRPANLGRHALRAARGRRSPGGRSRATDPAATGSDPAATTWRAGTP